MTEFPPDITTDFKRAMRRLAATVTIISTADASGTRFGMTATAVTSVSMDPPSLLICVNGGASLHAPLRERGAFCVNVLTSAQADLVGAFGGKRTGDARFGLGQWRSSPEGLPYLEAAQSNLFCEVDRELPYGSHSVFIGRVTHVRVEEDVRPLIFSNGQLRALAQTDTVLHG